MNFKIEAWEIPPGADANNLSMPIEFGPVDWDGAPTMISARWLEFASGEALAFFRPHSGAINYVVTREDNAPLVVSKKHVNSKTLGRIARGALDEGKFGRLFYCHGECLLFRESRCYWESQDYWQKESPITIPFDTHCEPSARIYNWIQQQWHDENSELRFSLEWSQKTEQEQNRWLGTIVSRWNELHDLMRAAAYVAELPTGERWIMNHIDTHNHSPELLGRLQPLRKLFHESFSFEPLPNSYPKFLREYFQMAACHVQVQGTESTAHQQLEARLLLCDWLQLNAPDHLHLIQ